MNQTIAHNIREDRKSFNEYFAKDELHGLTTASDAIVINQLEYLKQEGDHIEKYEYGGFTYKTTMKKGVFGGESEKDRIKYALTVVDELNTVRGVPVDFDSKYDIVLDPEWDRMYVPHVSTRLSDENTVAIARLMAEGLTHSAAHLHEGNTLLHQAIAAPQTTKTLDLDTGRIISHEPRSYFETSCVTKYLKLYYAHATEGISIPAYITNSRRKKAAGKTGVDLDQTDRTEKGVLPTQAGTLTINSHDVNVAKKVTSCVIAFSAAACQFEEDGFSAKDVVYNMIHPKPEEIRGMSELFVFSSDIPPYPIERADFKKYHHGTTRGTVPEMLSYVHDYGLDAKMALLSVEPNGNLTIGRLSEMNRVIEELQEQAISERMLKHHATLNLGNRIYVTSEPFVDDNFDTVPLGTTDDAESILRVINEEFIMKGRDTKDYTSESNKPKQKDWMPDTYDYWDHDGLLEKVLFEVIEFVLSGSPDKQLKKYKGMFSTLMNFIFARAKSGKGVNYFKGVDIRGSTELHGYNTYDIDGYEDGKLYNDELAYEGFSDVLEEEFKELEDNGMIHTYKLLKELVEPARITRWHWRARVFLDSLLAINGYGRTELALSHKKQIEAELAPHDPPMAKYIFDLARHMMHVADEKEWFPTQEEFDDVLVSTMKPTSSGVSEAGQPVSSSMSYMDPESGKEKTITGLGKILYMIANIEKLMNADNYQSDNHDVWTKENPGRTGSRNVVGAKAARAIFMADMITFRGLYPLASIMDKFQATAEEGGIGGYDFYGSRIYTVGKETGSPLKDHADAMLASSDPKVFAAMTDFSAFDATEQYPNMWKPFIEGLLKGCEEVGVGEGSDYVLIKSATGGADMGFAHLIKELLGKKFSNPLYFLTEGAGWEEEALQVAEQAMMPSGLLITLSGNNVCNVGDFQVVMDEKEKRPDLSCFKLEEMRVMGDDRLVLFRTPMKPTAKQIRDMRNLFSEVAESNGMSMNPAKVTFRNCEFEYLKKRGCYGVVVHKSHVAIHANEAVNQREEPLEMIRSYLSTLRVWAWRSGDPVYAEKLGILFARTKLNFRDTGRFVKSKDGGETRDKFSMYPTLHILYVPGVLGGIGHNHRDMYSSSVDGVIVNKMGADPRFNRHIQLGAKLIYDTYSADISDHVTSLWNTGQVEKGSNDFDRFKTHLSETRDDFRYHMAAQAEDALIALGQPNVAKRLDYRRMGERVTENLLESVPQIQDIKYQRLAYRGRIIKQRMDKMALIHSQLLSSNVPVRGELPDIPVPAVMTWLTTFRFEPVGVLEPLHAETDDVSPFQCNAVIPYISLAKVLGVSTESSSSAMDLKGLINKLYKDRRMRRDISIETIADILLSHVQDETVMYWALIRIGALPAYAAAAVQEVQNNKAKYLTAAAASKMGSFVSDQLLPNLGINLDLLNRVLVHNDLIQPGDAPYSMLLSMTVSRMITDFLKYGKFMTYRLVKISRRFGKEYMRLLKGTSANALGYNISFSELMNNEMNRASGGRIIRRLEEEKLNPHAQEFVMPSAGTGRVMPEVVKIARNTREKDSHRRKENF